MLKRVTAVLKIKKAAPNVDIKKIQTPAMLGVTPKIPVHMPSA